MRDYYLIGTMVLLEAEVHSSLLRFLREHQYASWVHHLTMARIVSRALRLQGSALIQTGSTIKQYSLSYLTPALLSDNPVVLVAPEWLQERLLEVEIPLLKQWLKKDKEVITQGQHWPGDDFQGIILISPQNWLNNFVIETNTFPNNVPILIDQANDIPEWTREFLTITITTEDWHNLKEKYPDKLDRIREHEIKLTKLFFAHPANPYECHLINQTEKKYLYNTFIQFAGEAKLMKFCQKLFSESHIQWVAIDRKKGQFTLNTSPLEIGEQLSPIWGKQPVVLMGGFLDSEKNAPTYRRQIGLGELLCLKFSPNPSNECIKLYLPKGIPLPNTPEFQGVLIQQLHTLVHLCQNVSCPVVILVEDVPLKAQLGTRLAAVFGSRVVVEKTTLIDNGILVCGWDFWHSHQELFPTPQLLVITTLPIPSLENPLVAGRVAYYKRRQEDWFRYYLLPTALRELERAVMPLRESQQVVALFDNRVNSRSYGSQILNALEPYSRINYLDASWFI